VDARTSEHWENGHLARSRARAEELGRPERLPATYATAYFRYRENFAKVKPKRDTKVALRGWINIHVACLLIMFLQWRLAMPHMRHKNVRHATLFSAPRAAGLGKTTGAEEKNDESPPPALLAGM